MKPQVVFVFKTSGGFDWECLNLSCNGCNLCMRGFTNILLNADGDGGSVGEHVVGVR